MAYFLMFGVLYVIFSGLFLLLVLVIPPAAITAILVHRYQGRMMELQNSDLARWEE